jgi:hypothetical protein
MWRFARRIGSTDVAFPRYCSKSSTGSLESSWGSCTSQGHVCKMEQTAPLAGPPPNPSSRCVLKVPGQITNSSPELQNTNTMPARTPRFNKKSNKYHNISARLIWCLKCFDLLRLTLFIFLFFFRTKFLFYFPKPHCFFSSCLGSASSRC